MRISNVLVGLLGGLLLAGLTATASAQTVEVRVGTIVPSGSAWGKIYEKGLKEIETKTAGRVKFKFFFAGQQGDEQDIVRKMKLGQLDGGALTSMGLGLINGNARILDLLFLFSQSNYKVIDAVRDRLAPDVEKLFADGGYDVLSWAELGSVYIFTNTQINSKADILKTKMWAWKDDVIVRALFKRIGLNGTALGAPEVLASLQTGAVDACYGTPLTMVAMQWYTKVKFAVDLPVAYSTAALVLRKQALDKMTPEDRAIVKAVGRSMGAELLKNVRGENDRARKVLQKVGVNFVALPPATLAEFQQVKMAVINEFSGKVFSKDLVTKGLKYLAEAQK